MASFGDLLRLARHYRGLTQIESAKRIGIAQAVFSRMENDLLEIDSSTKAKAAQVFDVPESFFEIADPVYGPPVSVHTMLRGKKSEVSARDVDAVTAELNLRLIHLRRFLENVDYSPATDIPRLDVEHYGSVSKIAATVRAHWKVPAGPIKNLTLLLERAGVIVGDSEFAGAAISGVTFAAPGRVPIVLVNRHHPADRLRFTLAHELGHLVMHRFPTANMEEEANQFASAFLFPPNEAVNVFRGRKVTLELLASLKLEWRMSMASLLMAAQTAKPLNENQSRYLWAQFSAKGWRTGEPPSLDFPFDPPTVLPSIIRAHLDDLGFSMEELTKMSKLHRHDVIKMYGPLREDEPSRPKLRIVS